MTKFIESPNLPKSDVKLMICGNLPQTLYNAFLSYDINIITLNGSSHLQAPVACHADMLCHHLGNNKILLSNDNISIKKQLNDLGIYTTIINKTLNSNYPKDILLNAARLDDKIICNRNYIAQEILDFCDSNDIDIIDVKQGYSKCSICVVNNNAIITEDESIKNACEKHNIDVLLIKKGFVKLSGYDYGFIGGCSVKVSRNKIAFFGNIKTHPDYNKIKSFLNKYNIEPVSLMNGNLIDIGGAIPLIEKCE